MFNRKAAKPEETEKEYYIFSQNIPFKILEEKPRAIIRSFMQYCKDNPLRRIPYKTLEAAENKMINLDAQGYEYNFIIVARAIPPTQPLEMTDFYQILMKDIRCLYDGFKMTPGDVLKYFETEDNFATCKVRCEPLPGMNPEILAEFQRREPYLKNGFDLMTDYIKEVTSASFLTTISSKDVKSYLAGFFSLSDAGNLAQVNKESAEKARAEKARAEKARAWMKK